MNLSPWARVAILLAVLAASYVGVKVFENRAYNRGYDARDAIARQDEDKATRAALERLAKAAADAKTREDALRAKLADADKQRHEENRRHEQTVKSLTARATAGAISLRADVSGGPSRDCPAPDNRPLAAGPGDETRADLMPGTVADILRIAADSARDVRRYNRLVDRYNAVVEACNAQ